MATLVNIDFYSQEGYIPGGSGIIDPNIIVSGSQSSVPTGGNFPAPTFTRSGTVSDVVDTNDVIDLPLPTSYPYGWVFYEWETQVNIFGFANTQCPAVYQPPFGGSSMWAIPTWISLSKVYYCGNGKTSGSVPVDSNLYSGSGWMSPYNPLGLLYPGNNVNVVFNSDGKITVLGNTNGLAKAGYVFWGWGIWNTNLAGHGSGYPVNQQGDKITLQGNISAQRGGYMDTSELYLFAAWWPELVPSTPSPSSGVSSGGTYITIPIGDAGVANATSGQIELINYTVTIGGVPATLIGGAPATNFTGDSRYWIQVVTPPGIVGTQTVEITSSPVNSIGQPTQVATTTFTYFNPTPTPTPTNTPTPTHIPTSTSVLPTPTTTPTPTPSGVAPTPSPSKPPGNHVVYLGGGNTGGTVPVDPTIYSSGSYATVMSPGTLVKLNFEFLGWDDVTGIMYQPGDNFIVSAS